MRRHRAADHERRRAEDRFREEHHDAHAHTIVAGMAVVPEVSPPEPVRARPDSGPPVRMRMRIVKTPPALLMDGFEVGGLLAGHVYDVDGPTAAYLQIAGYAVPYTSKQPVSESRPDSSTTEPA